MRGHQKLYKANLSGELRSKFEEYKSQRGLGDAAAMRECIKYHITNKKVTPDIQIRLRTLEILMRELLSKLS